MNLWGSVVERRKGLVLHYYQTDAVEAVESLWDKWKKQLIVLPTGAGKTITAGEIVAREIERKGNVLMIAHTRKLVVQFGSSLEKNYGVLPGFMISQVNHNNERLICSTVQSMASRIKKGRWDGPTPTLIIMDEAHRGLSPSHQLVAKTFPLAKVLGVTATPRRGDKKDLMSFFEYKAIDIPLSQLIKEGFLADIDFENFPIEIKVERLPNRGRVDEGQSAITDEEEGETSKGDYSAEEIAHAIDPYLTGCADEFVKYAKDRCALVFLPLISTSKKFTNLLRERGMRVEHVDGQMSGDRVAEIIEDLEIGNIDCICNSMLLTEGIDIRPVNLIMSLRLTTSWPLYVQIIGRGTRTFNPADAQHNPHGEDCKWGLKDKCLVLDPLWACDEHSLIQRPSCLVAETDEERDALDAKLKQKKKKKKTEAEDEDDEEYMSLMEALDAVRNDREDNMRKRLERNSRKAKRRINALDCFLKVGRLDLAEYEPEAAWEMENVTAGQRKILMENKFDLKEIKSRGHASKIIDMLFARAKQGKSTIKQAHYAETAFGMTDAYTRSLKDVSAFIEKAKAGKDPYRNIPD